MTMPSAGDVGLARKRGKLTKYVCEIKVGESEVNE